MIGRAPPTNVGVVKVPGCSPRYPTAPPSLPLMKVVKPLAAVPSPGVRDVCFIIGGADGLDAAVKARANMNLSFGSMTWPHLLVRGMLAEQLFRAQCILAGHPYHRD